MKLDRIDLAAAASAAARMATGRGGFDDIWSMVRLTSNDGRLFLTAMDSANRLEISVEGYGGLDPVCVHAGRFAEVIGSLLADEVELAINGPRLNIVAGSGKRSLATRLAADYPEPEFDPSINVTIPGAMLKEAISFALPHVAPADDVTKRTMSGIYLGSSKHRLRAIGTDAHEMAVFDVGHCEQDFTTTLNPKVAEFVAKLAPGGNVLLRLSAYQVEVSWAHGLVRGPIIADDFPIRPVEHALGKDYEKSVSLEANAFLAALQSIRPIGEMDSLSRSRRVKLTLNGCGMVSTQSGEGSAEQEFPADWQSEPRDIGFASARMDRILRHFGDDVLTIGIRDDESAMRIEAAGKPDRLCLLFPLRL